MKKLIIDRNTWCRGKPITSRLLTEGGSRCCLGFLGQSCGLKDDQMYSLAMPESTLPLRIWPIKLFKFPDIYGTYNSSAILSIINDIENIDEDTRELWIKEGFKVLLDYEVEFIN